MFFDFGPGTDFISLLILFFLFFLLLLLLGRPSSQKPKKLHHSKLDRGEILWECSSSKYASIDGVGFDFPYDVMVSRWWPWRYFMQQSAAHAASSRTYAAASASSWSIVHSYYTCFFKALHASNQDYLLGTWKHCSQRIPWRWKSIISTTEPTSIMLLYVSTV